MLLKVFLIMIFLGVCGFRYNAPLDPQTSFYKHNTQELQTRLAHLMLQLQDEYHFTNMELSITSANDNINLYYSNQAHQIINRVLNQTSGITDYTDSSLWWLRLYLFPNRIWHADELVDIAYNAKQSNDSWNYSNTNYVLLGMIAEKISHHPFKDFVDAIRISKTFH